MSKAAPILIAIIAICWLPLPVESQEDQLNTDHGGKLEAEARKLVRHQIPPDALEELYQQTTPLMVMAVENSIQTSIERPITDFERYRLTVFCNQRIRELVPYEVLEDLLAPIVTNHLTLEDLESINAFLSTPSGQKLASIQAAVMREGQAAGEALAQRMADSDEIEEMSEELKKQFPQWFSADASQADQQSASSMEGGVFSYWSTAKGDRMVVDGKTFDGDSQLIRESTTEYETKGETPCGDSVCIGYRMLVHETDENGEANDSEMFYYQKITSNFSCTWGIGWTPEERYSVGCTFRDLEGPIEKGKTWSFSDSLPGLERQFEMSPSVSYAGRIVATGLETKVGDEVIQDCVEVIITGSAEPNQAITCEDGQESRVVSKKTNSRIYCPGMGSVWEENTEKHWKVADPSVVCTSYSSEYQTVSFDPAAPVP